MERDAEVAARLAALEHRVAALEASAGPPAPEARPPREARETGGPGGLDSGDGGDGQFWALAGLRDRSPDGGAVLFAGTLRLPDGAQYEWQWGEPAAALLDTDWSPLAPALGALAHPVRLQLLKEVLGGTAAVADLQASGSFGTSGQVYHHLRQLVAAGWLRSTGRGSYAVPPARVIPLLVILSAAR